MMRPAPGFTLIELLVGLTLMGLISVLLFGGLRFGARAWEVGEKRTGEVNRVIVVQDFLRRHLARASLPMSLIDGIAFAGTPDAVRFIAPLPPHFGSGGLHTVEVRIEPENRYRHLVVAWQIYRSDTPMEMSANPAYLLIPDIGDARFAFFGADADGAELAWHDQWVAIDRLPALVSLQIAFPAGDHRSWPFLTVAPRLQGVTR
jgi:general secretion pathway protein J